MAERIIRNVAVVLAVLVGAVLATSQGAALAQQTELMQLNVRNAPVQEVLKLIAEGGGFNLAIGDEVKGSVTLRNIGRAENIEAVPLNGAGERMGDSIPARVVEDGFEIPIGEPATPWYLVSIRR